MTLAALVLGSVLSAAGTRAALAAFGAAALLGVGSQLPAPATWTAVMLVGLASLPRSPRRLALPAVGAAAALGAGSARNAAVVLALWTLATASVVVPAVRSGPGRRWGLSLLATDAAVAAALWLAAADAGFEAWPTASGAPAAVLLIAAGLVKASLVSGPDEESSDAAPGLVTVRAQAAVLFVTAVAAAGAGPWILRGAVAAGAGVFAAAGWSRRSATRDSAQEGALLLMVVALASLGAGPVGWEWGVLAGGTLMHNVRLRVGPRQTAPLAGLLSGPAVLGLPLLPGVQALLEGSVGVGGWLGLACVLAVVAGLASRARSPDAAPPEARRPAPVGALVAACAGGVALWAPALTLPSGSAGASVGWPPWWAAVLVAASGATAAMARRWARREDAPARDRAQGPELPDALLPGRVARPSIIWAALGGLVAAALALWAVGVTRGFL